MGIDQEEDIKRKAIELNLRAARKRQSPQTGFVHHCYESDGERQDTIPLFENFCFVLALLRSKQSENMLEGIALLNKLLAFENDGHFPVYLHEYPLCKDRMLSLRSLRIFQGILHDFHAILERPLKEALEQLIGRIVSKGYKAQADGSLSAPYALMLSAYFQPKDFPSAFSFQDTLSEIRSEQLPPKQRFSTPEQIAYALIAAQMAHLRGGIHITPFTNALLDCGHPSLLTYVDAQEQEKTLPKPTLFDLFLCDYHKEYPERILADHPMHLRASLVYPLEKREIPEKQLPLHTLSSHPRQPFVLYWGSLEQVHSLVCDPKQTQYHIEKRDDGADFLFHLQTPPSELDVNEINFFCNLHPDHTILPLGKKATAFALNEPVEIHSKDLKIELSFCLLEGEGTFFGHLLRGNRPLQSAAKGALRYEAFDWQIAVRTVKRSTACTLRASIRWNT